MRLDHIEGLQSVGDHCDDHGQHIEDRNDASDGCGVSGSVGVGHDGIYLGVDDWEYQHGNQDEDRHKDQTLDVQLTVIVELSQLV